MLSSQWAFSLSPIKFSQIRCSAGSTHPREKNKAWKEAEYLGPSTEHFHWVFEKTSYGLHESVISLWRVDISNPKELCLELVLPLPSGPTRFPWAISKATCKYLVLQGSVFSAEQCSQSPGAAPQHSWPWWTGLSFTDWELVDMSQRDFTGL